MAAIIYILRQCTTEQAGSEQADPPQDGLASHRETYG